MKFQKSIAAAARSLNKPHGNAVIIEACRAGRNYAYGYYWKIL